MIILRANSDENEERDFVSFKTDTLILCWVLEFYLSKTNVKLKVILNKKKKLFW